MGEVSLRLLIYPTFESGNFLSRNNQIVRLVVLEVHFQSGIGVHNDVFIALNCTMELRLILKKSLGDNCGVKASSVWSRDGSNCFYEKEWIKCQKIMTECSIPILCCKLMFEMKTGHK